MQILHVFYLIIIPMHFPARNDDHVDCRIIRYKYKLDASRVEIMIYNYKLNYKHAVHEIGIKHLIFMHFFVFIIKYFSVHFKYTDFDFLLCSINISHINTL